MEKRKIYILLLGVICLCHSKEPYEATWLALKKVDGSYVVYKYPFMSAYGDLDTTMKTLEMVRVRGNRVTWITYSEIPMLYSYDNVEKRDRGVYFFGGGEGNNCSFQWVDKEKHIARWIVYSSYGEIADDNLYIDSLYNTFPIVDYKWKD